MTQPREVLLRSVADITTRIKYDFTLLKNVIGELIPQTETAGNFFSFRSEAQILFEEFY